MILVNELFYSLQGEGKYLGTPSLFVRLNICNLRCQWINKDGTYTKCDTPYTSWNPEKSKQYKLDDLINEIDNIIGDKNTNHIVITGGEPFMQNELPDLVNRLSSRGYIITIETNGTIYKDTKAHLISLSPKLNNSIPSLDFRDERFIHQQGLQRYDKYNTIEQFIENYNDRLVFKFVCNGEEDLQEIKDFIKKYNVDNSQVYLMPQGISKEELQSKQQELFNICMNEGYCYTPRLHIDVFNSKRGV